MTAHTDCPKTLAAEQVRAWRDDEESEAQAADLAGREAHVHEGRDVLFHHRHLIGKNTGGSFTA